MYTFVKEHIKAIGAISGSFLVGVGIALLLTAAGGSPIAPKLAEGPITLSQCSKCHPNLDAFKNPILIFNHWVHFKKGIRCEACHVEFPHKAEGVTSRPPMDVCYACHGLRHGNQGLIAPEACTDCHPKNFTAMPNNHTPKFRSGGHNKMAAKNQEYCLMCHERRFCVSCHIAKKALPGNHKDKARWRSRHGKDKTPAQLNECQVCHPRSFCDDCHGTRVPHAGSWIDSHRDEGKAAGAKCDQCHQQRAYCQECHHSGVERGLLIKDRCVRCHEIYKKVLFQINSKAHAVHRAHFDMTKTPPFRCNACHGKEYAKGQGCFAFELCKTCHGKIRLGRLVAKWEVDDGSLCMVCHQGRSQGAGSRAAPPAGFGGGAGTGKP